MTNDKQAVLAMYEAYHSCGEFGGITGGLAAMTATACPSRNLTMTVCAQAKVVLFIKESGNTETHALDLTQLEHIRLAFNLILN